MTVYDLTEAVERVFRDTLQLQGIEPDSPWYVLHLEEKVGELIQSYLMLSGKARKKGKSREELKKEFENDVIAVFCSVLVLAKEHKIDLEKAIENKWLKKTG